jgi:hypothetical protein
MPATGNHMLIAGDTRDIPDRISLRPGRNAFKVFTQSRIGYFTHELKEMQPGLALINKNPGWADGCRLCALIKKNIGLLHMPLIMFSALP